MKVAGVLSDPVRVVSGVPQGSVLGPLFFLILMIDIDAGILKAALGSFADDTRVWSAIISVLEANHFQEDLNRVFEWTAINNMQVNGDKSEHMRFGQHTFEVQYLDQNRKQITTALKILASS